MTDKATTGTGTRAAELITASMVDVPDFPQPGVVFKDLTPLFADGPAFRGVIDAIAERYVGQFDVVVGVEARGFVIAAAVAYATGMGVVPVRKKGKLPRPTFSASYALEYGKLPRPTFSASYALEYGEATLEVHQDAFVAGQRVLLLDDVLATGGTVEAAAELVGRAGGGVAGVCVLLELSFLGGRRRLGDLPLTALVTI